MSWSLVSTAMFVATRQLFWRVPNRIAAPFPSVPLEVAIYRRHQREDGIGSGRVCACNDFLRIHGSIQIEVAARSRDIVDFELGNLAVSTKTGPRNALV